VATAVQKIILSASRDIPFNKLALSQGNVRRVKAGVSIEVLAEEITRRTLLQGLSVRPILDAEGQETGMFEVPAGRRRYRALELLVKQKRLAKTVPVPCVVRDPNTEVSSDEDSLAENVQRVALHPLDQFRAFQSLRDKSLGTEGRGAILRRTDGCEAASAARRRLREAPRRLCRGPHDAGAAHGLHRHQRPCAPGAGLGGAVADGRGSLRSMTCMR
jgi:ParB/RepB/Spo0J family partition protein